jgi:hypothetical protein
MLYNTTLCVIPVKNFEHRITLRGGEKTLEDQQPIRLIRVTETVSQEQQYKIPMHLSITWELIGLVDCLPALSQLLAKGRSNGVSLSRMPMVLTACSTETSRCDAVTTDTTYSVGRQL